MSNYNFKAKNIKTGKIEDFTALDDYFGRHQYGYKDNKGIIYSENSFFLEYELCEPMTQTQPTMERDREEINTRLWYALGDIEPTEEKMKRAVESMSDLLLSKQSTLIEKLREEIEKLEVLWLSRSPDESSSFNKCGINKSQVLNIIINLTSKGD